MTNTEIQLLSGKKVILEDFSMKLTYNLLVGKPDTQLNYKIIRDIKESYEGKRAVFILEGAYESIERLKPYICSARLSSEPRYKDYDGSYMYIVWFVNETTTSIEEMIKGLNIDWEVEAEDFKF